MYKILQDENGDLLLLIDPQKFEPDGPLFIYDGGDTALLFRNWDSAVRLRIISEQPRPYLKGADHIYVFEVKGDDILRDYVAPVRIVKDVKKLIAS
jgi:hypothetical protein